MNATSKSSWGGSRTGAGRKSNGLRLKRLSVEEKRKIFYETVGEETFRKIIESLIKRAKTDSRIAIWIVEQVMGKFPTPAIPLTNSTEPWNVTVKDYEPENESSS